MKSKKNPQGHTQAWKWMQWNPRKTKRNTRSALGEEIQAGAGHLGSGIQFFLAGSHKNIQHATINTLASEEGDWLDSQERSTPVL